MKEKDLISIVIPIYNVEKYLKRCIDSVINQTYTNLEIILVDDGSTDKCPEICDYYEKQDKRIKVIHKKNGGLSDARNDGIEMATGRYINFIDSDDYVTNNYIELLYSQLIKNNADISVAILKNVFENGTEKSIYNTKKQLEMTKSSLEMLELMLYQKYFDNSANISLYKYELFDNIRFPSGKLYEDFSTIYKLYLKSNKITYINKEIYYYFQRKTSIVGQSFRKKEMDLIDASEILVNDIENLNYNKYYKSSEEARIMKKKLIKAAKVRALSANFYILRKINCNKEFEAEEKRCIENIRKYKHFNVNARLKNNIAIILFNINPKIVEKL